MPKFAIYYIPEGVFYQKGTAILGYDIREQSMLPKEQQLKGIQASWVKKSQPYGFHMTIGDAIDFEWEQLEVIEKELKEVLACFDPQKAFELRAHPEKFICFLGTKKEVVALRYLANDYLRFFHTMIVARINPLGIGSIYSNAPNNYTKQNYKRNRITKFYSPYILDNFLPHFTLLNPFRGNHPEEIKATLLKIFQDYQKIKVSSICLMLQRDATTLWEIHNEYRRLKP